MRNKLIFIFLLTLSLCIYSEISIAEFGGEGAFGSLINYLKRVTTNIIPSATATYDLGSSSKAFKNAYFGDLQLSGTGPDYTLAVTSGDTFGWHAESQITYLKNDTDNKFYLLADTNHYLNLVPFMTDGRVGINQGLGSPSYNLDVTGTGRFTSTLKIGAYTLPATDGINGQQLTTDGAGNITFGAAGGHDAVTVTDTTTINLTLTGQDITADGLYTAGDDLTLTGADFDVDATVTRDTEWDSLSEINTASTDADILIFQNLAVTGQTTVATDAVADTLTLVGAGITAITTNATTDTITFTSTEVDGSTTNEAPTTADYLVGTSDGGLSAEIVVGATPGGSLGGTWASPTIDDLFILNSAADTMLGNLTINSADPALILDGSTATDTDFWLGVTADEGGDDDDLFQIGDGTTPGTNPFLTINTSGNVGIGRIPAAVLDVEGATYLRGTVSTPGIYLWVNAATITTYGVNDNYATLNSRKNDVGNVEIARMAGATDPYFSMGGSQQFKFYNSGYLTFPGSGTIDTAGNVGIGTTGPTTQLHITGDLTVGGGDITLGTTSIFSGGDTASLNNIDAIDATTETTLEAAIDTLGSFTEGGLADSTIVSADIKDATVAYGDMVANIPGLPHHLIVNVANPNVRVTADTQICIWPLTPAALTVTKIEVTLDASANEVLGDVKYADTFIGLANATVINDFDTTSGIRSDSTITSGAVASGKTMYLQFDSTPNAAITQMTIDIQFNY